MRNSFLRFYTGMLVAICALLLLTAGAMSVKNMFRHESYINEVMSGTFLLLARAVNRESSENRAQWLLDFKKETGFGVDILSFDNVTLDHMKRQKLTDKGWVVISGFTGVTAKIFIKIPDDEKQVLLTTSGNADESMARALAYLLIDEIDNSRGLTKKIQDLASLFTFPVKLSKINDAEFGNLQQSILKTGKVLIEREHKAANEFSYMIYIRAAKDLLVVGPIPVFNQFSWQLFVIAGILNLFLMALAAYMLVSPLEKRLKRMTAEIENAGVESGDASITVEGKDVLGSFAEKVNAMAGRIQNLLESQKELTKGVSHELKTPIARIKFHLEFLDGIYEKTDKPQIFKKHMNGVKNNVYQLEHLVDEMLTYTSLEENKPVLRFVRFDLAELVNRQIEELQSVKPDIELRFRYEKEHPFVIADEHFLKRACQNLLINAQRHTKSLVEVNYEKKGKYNYLNFDDNGDGVPDSMWQTILEPFRRLDPSRNRQSGGYGLGLSIVYQIMRWHNGNIEISDSPQGGARFCLKWPDDLQ